MNLFIAKLNIKLNNQLQSIDLKEPRTILKAQKSITCIQNALLQLKAFIATYPFKSESEEILFFKEIKPGIFSNLIYFVRIFNIESRRPLGSIDLQKNYLQHELEKLTFFFNSHLEFYQYHRINSTYLDDKYFVLSKEDIYLHLDSLMFYVDPDFSTSHNYMVAKIIAYDRLEVFLNKESEILSIKALNPNWGHMGLPAQNLQWTDCKTSLVELIYALCASGVINHGNCEIRELSAFFEQAFNIRLPDVYRTFLEIKIRSTPTKFIDNLKASLIHKIEEDI